MHILARSRRLILRASIITALLIATFAGCSREGSRAASDAVATSRGGQLPAARCEMVARDNGPCILWEPSLIELIARPELYDGRRVRVIGFVNFEFEGNGLYLSREDWRQSIARNGLWINALEDFEGDSGALPRPNQRYVIVEATFRGGPGGHFGMWSGSLDSVTRLEPWGVGEGEAKRPPRSVP
jgi:hypothetical protein